MISSGSLIWPIVFRASLVLVVVFGLIGFAVGLGLILSRARTFRVLHGLNRWVSLRRAFKPVEIPRDVDHLAHRYRYWVGVPLIAGGLFSTFGLLARIKGAAVGAIFAKGPMLPLLSIALEAARWFLVAGSVVGVLIGLMLCFSPDTLRRLERHANKWVSPRQLSRGADQMYPTIDRLVEAHPGKAGWILVCTGLGAVVYAGFLMLTR